MYYNMKKIKISITDTNQDYTISANIRKTSNKWIVCLHGIQSNKDLFNDIFSIPYFDDYSILAIDFIGFGESDKPENFSYDIDDQAMIISRVVENLKIQKLHIIGHSLGGMVGILLLNYLKEKILSFVNMEGNLVLEDCGLSLKVASRSFDEFKNKYFGKIKLDLEKSKAPNAYKRRKWIESVPDYAFYKTSESIVKWSKGKKMLNLFISSLNRKLYVYGQKNLFKAKRLPSNINVAEISNAGHFMLLDNSGECYKKIIGFLSK